MDMTWTELYEYEDKTALELQSLTTKIDAHQIQIDRGRGESHFPKACQRPDQ